MWFDLAGGDRGDIVDIGTLHMWFIGSASVAPLVDILMGRYYGNRRHIFSV